MPDIDTITPRLADLGERIRDLLRGMGPAPTGRLILTPREVREQARESGSDFTIPEDWRLKVTRTGSFPEVYTFITPQGREVSARDISISNGMWSTTARTPSGGITPSEARQLVADIGREAAAREMGGIPAWSIERGDYTETGDIGEMIPPSVGEIDLFLKGLTQVDISDISQWATDSPDEFLDVLSGLSAIDASNLLRAIEATEEDIGEIIGAEVREPVEVISLEERTKQYRAEHLLELGYKPAPPVGSPEERQERAAKYRAYRNAGGRLTAGQWELMGMPTDITVTLPSLEERRVIWEREAEEVSSILKVFGEALTKIPQQLSASILQAIQGQGGASVVDKDWADRLIKVANTDLDAFVQKVGEEYPKSGFPISLTDIAELPRNIAFSLTSMGVGLAVGVPITFVPLPGARIAAWFLGSAASGVVAYSMTTYQIMQQYLELKDEEKRTTTGKGLTLQEENQLKLEFEGQARAYGLWEALPEAISNLAFVPILLIPLGRVIGKKMALQILKKITLMYGEEFLTETITQLGQSAIEVEAGLREGKITPIEAFKEIAPQTFLLTTILWGTGQVGISAVNRIKTSLRQEIGETHPLYETINSNITEETIPTIEVIVTATMPEVVMPDMEDAREPVAPRIKLPEKGIFRTGDVFTSPEGELKINFWAASEGKWVVTLPDGTKTRMTVESMDALVDRGVWKFKEVTPEAVTPVEEVKRPAVPEAVPEVKLPEVGFVTNAIGTAEESWQLTDISETTIGREYEFTKLTPTGRLSQTTQRFPEQQVRDLPELAIPKPPAVEEVIKTFPQVVLNHITDKINTKTGLAARLATFTDQKYADLVKKSRDELQEIWDREYPPKRAIAFSSISEAYRQSVGEKPAPIIPYKGEPAIPKPPAVEGVRVEEPVVPEELKAEVPVAPTEEAPTPLTTVPEPTAEQVATNLAIAGQPTLTPAQVEKTLTLFGLYVASPSTQSAWQLTRELRRETLSQRAESLKARTQELIISEGMPVEEAMKQAIRETMSGELPIARTDYLEDLTDQMRDALFNKVYQTLRNEPFEMTSTVTALTNALLGKSIPREPGVMGGSAYTRLQRVFTPEVFKAIEKATKEGKSLQDMVEGLYEVVGQPPIPVDQKTADYLRGLSTDILYEPTAFREPVPVTKFEAPIEKAFEQYPMFTFMEKKTIVRVLKELAYSPLDIGNFLRANKASLDQSFLRQAKMMASGHPIMFAQAYRKAWQATFSQRATEASWERITRDPDFQIYEQIRLDAGHDPLRVPAYAGVKGTAQYRTAEEFGFPTQERWIPTLTGKIPWIKLSERGFSTGLNELTWGVWKAKLQFARKYSEKIASGQVKLKEGEAFDIVREMTDQQAMLADMGQRATLRRAAGLAPAFNAFFFALRSKMGRFLMPRHLISRNPRVRKEAWKNFLLMNAIVGGIMLLGDWLDLWETEKDPRNAEVMSARIGNIRIDPWAGYRQFVVLYARLATGTGVSSVTGAEYEINKISALTTFVRSSLSPMASILLDFWTGRNFLGQVVEITNSRQWLERLLPFSIVDVWEAYEYDSKMGLIVIPLAIHGEGVQTYTGDWVENWTKMGIPKYIENTAYGLDEPYYDTADFWSDTASQFRGVDPTTLTEAKGYPPYIRDIVETMQILEQLKTLPNLKLISINTDPAEGLTLGQYYQMWEDRQKLVVAGDDAEWITSELQLDGKYKEVAYKGEDALKAFDRKYPQAELGNMTQRQYALLVKYHSFTERGKQAEFLEGLDDEVRESITTNLRKAWLKANPKDNARLAIWGKARLLTLEAYKEFNKILKELDIPNDAIPELTLPPKTSIETHFKYEEMVSEGTHGSWEADLLLLQDAEAAMEAKVQSYVGWRTEGGNPLKLTDTPMSSLLLKTEEKYRELFHTISRYSDEDSPQYIVDEDERKREIEKIRLTEITTGVEFRDIERQVKAIEKGTNDKPTPQGIIDAHVEYGRLEDEEGVNSNKKLALFRIDNLEYNEWRMDEDLWNKPLQPIEEDRIRIWRLDIQWAEKDAEYEAFRTDEDREAFLARWMPYHKSRLLRKVYAIDGFPEEQIDTYVRHYTDPSLKKPEGWKDKTGTDDWYEDDWFLQENPEFHEAMIVLNIWEEKREKGRVISIDKYFPLVPTRKVFKKYLIYLSIPQYPAAIRKNYRIDNTDFDDWLVDAKGFIPADPADKKVIPDYQQRIAEFTMDIDKQLEELGERIKELTGGY